MKKILTDETKKILHNRIDISRNTKIINLEQISKGWKISRRTLYRNEDKKEDII